MKSTLLIPWLVLMLSWISSSMALLDLSILGNKYINSDFKYNTDPGAGVRNREEYARQFGQMGERLVEELGKGHHGPDVANLPPQLAPRPHTVRQRRKVRSFLYEIAKLAYSEIA